MNIFSMIFMAVIWAVVSSSIFLLLRNNEGFAKKNKALFLIALLLLGFFLPVYAKIAVANEFYFNSSDEGVLWRNYTEFLEGKDISELPHASGIGVILLFYVAQILTGFSFKELLLFIGIMASVFIPVMVFLLFRQLTKSFRLSFGTAFISLLSSYFIWPVVEVRPQLFGFLILLFIFFQLSRFFQEKRAGALIVSCLAVVSLPFIHFLPFIYILPVLVVLITYFYVKSKKVVFSSFYLLVAWFVGLVLHNSFSLVILDLQWVLRTTLIKGAPHFFTEVIPFPFGFKVFAPLLFFGIAAIFLGFFVAVFLREKKKTVNRFYGTVREWFEANQRVALLGFLFGTLGLIVIQVFFNIDLILSLYGSLLLFLLLQSINLLVGVVASYAVFKLLFSKKMETKIVFLLMIPFAFWFVLTLAISPFISFGFSNFAMRTMNYLVIFLGFFCFSAFTWFQGVPFLKRVPLLVLMFFPGSLLVGTHDPSVLDDGVTYLSNQEQNEFFVMDDWFESQGVQGVFTRSFPVERTVINEDKETRNLDKVWVSKKRFLVYPSETIGEIE